MTTEEYLRLLDQHLTNLTLCRDKLQQEGREHKTVDLLIASRLREKQSKRVFKAGERVQYRSDIGHGYAGRKGVIQSIIAMGGGAWDWAWILDDNHAQLSEIYQWQPGNIGCQAVKIFAAPFWDLNLITEDKP